MKIDNFKLRFGLYAFGCPLLLDYLNRSAEHMLTLSPTGQICTTLLMTLAIIGYASVLSSFVGTDEIPADIDNV